jgi:SIR2-like domain
VDAAQLQLENHCRNMLLNMERSTVVPFLGAGANRCGRPPDTAWNRDTFLPDGGELATFLATRYQYPGPDQRDLGRVAQFATIELDQDLLYGDLRDIFTGKYRPNALHAFLAELPGEMKKRQRPPPFKLIVTTNYDDALETAFRSAGQDYDLVYYAAPTQQKAGEFVHVVGDQRVRVDQQYRGLLVGGKTVILKIHGAVNRTDSESDSYVITEDDYIDYLARSNIDELVPSSLMNAMRNGNFLFLGYGLRDWNLRVILKHIWAEQRFAKQSWAIQHEADDFDTKFWRRLNVNIVTADLLAWIETMRSTITGSTS